MRPTTRSIFAKMAELPLNLPDPAGGGAAQTQATTTQPAPKYVPPPKPRYNPNDLTMAPPGQLRDIRTDPTSAWSKAQATLRTAPGTEAGYQGQLDKMRETYRPAAGKAVEYAKQHPGMALAYGIPAAAAFVGTDGLATPAIMSAGARAAIMGAGAGIAGASSSLGDSVDQLARNFGGSKWGAASNPHNVRDAAYSAAGGAMGLPIAKGLAGLTGKFAPGVARAFSNTSVDNALADATEVAGAKSVGQAIAGKTGDIVGSSTLGNVLNSAHDHVANAWGSAVDKFHSLAGAPVPRALPGIHNARMGDLPIAPPPGAVPPTGVPPQMSIVPPAAPNMTLAGLPPKAPVQTSNAQARPRLMSLAGGTAAQPAPT